MIGQLRRRAGASIIAVILMMAAATTTTAAAPTPDRQLVADARVVSLAERVGAAHHLGDPRRGSVRLQAAVQVIDDPSTSTHELRATATLGKIDRAVRVQIDRVGLTLYSFAGRDLNLDEKTFSTAAPVNSGTGSTVNQVTRWVQANLWPADFQRYFVYTVVQYSVRWSDGTLTHGVFRSNVEQPGNSSAAGAANKDQRLVDAAGSALVNHRAGTGTGTVAIDAGIRLPRAAGGRNVVSGIQPFATVRKQSGASRVQIDAIEALGHPDMDANGSVDESEASITTAFPYNLTARSSGTGSSASLSTAVARVNPNRNGRLSYFQVAVYYSIRWTDGTLTAGRYVGPIGVIGHSFPGQQGH